MPRNDPPKTSPDAEGSSKGSAAAPSSDGALSNVRALEGAFVADAGPAFDADAHAHEPDPTPGLALEEPAGWQEAQVTTLLRTQGLLVHQAIAVDKETDEWRYTEAELRAIGAPLTRILNRYDATRAAAGTGDELALVIGMGGYVVRSYGVRRDALRAQAAAEEQGPQPISGHAPDPPSQETTQWTT